MCGAMGMSCCLACSLFEDHGAIDEIVADDAAVSPGCHFSLSAAVSPGCHFSLAAAVSPGCHFVAISALLLPCRPLPLQLCCCRVFGLPLQPQLLERSCRRRVKDHRVPDSSPRDGRDVPCGSSFPPELPSVCCNTTLVGVVLKMENGNGRRR